MAMPDDDLENPDDVVEGSSSRPEATQKKKALDFANDFIRGWSLIPVFISYADNIIDLRIALDVLVLSELAALYYADCITTTLLLRSITQVFLSPPINIGLPAQVPNPRSHLSIILFATFLSLLLHVFGGRPGADERGYLHGLVPQNPRKRDKLTCCTVVACSLTLWDTRPGLQYGNSYSWIYLSASFNS